MVLDNNIMDYVMRVIVGLRQVRIFV